VLSYLKGCCFEQLVVTLQRAFNTQFAVFCGASWWAATLKQAYLIKNAAWRHAVWRLALKLKALCSAVKPSYLIESVLWFDSDKLSADVRTTLNSLPSGVLFVADPMETRQCGDRGIHGNSCSRATMWCHHHWPGINPVSWWQHLRGRRTSSNQGQCYLWPIG
jgi:hypothetical protein